MKKLIIVVIISCMIVFFMAKATAPGINLTEKHQEAIIAQQSKFNLGDTQQDITLLALHAPAMPYGYLDQTDPEKFYIAAFEVSPNAPQADLLSAQIHISDGQYLDPARGSVKECIGSANSCVVFVVPKDALIDSFIYKKLTWYL